MRPIARGVMLAAIAAIAFGITAPIIKWAGAAVGPFTTAALLYAGAALAAGILRASSRTTEPGIRTGDVPRVLVVALVGGAIAPVLLAWGLQRSGATVGALLLNLEAVFTVVLARLIYREQIGARVALAVTAMATGGAALVLAATRTGEWSVYGVIAVTAATACWAIDNTLTRPLAEREPLSVVAAKGSVGAVLTFTVALIVGEPHVALRDAVVLLLCGATGYGLSLRLYLLAQRAIGAARTGSVFALAPFVGAALAIALGDHALSAWTGVAALLFATGVYLHVTERHAHPHRHEAVRHAHPHRHDDGHHDHTHEPPVIGEHTHDHDHDELAHEHDHAPDLHHDHVH